jgi:hypothetical protein
MKQHDLPPPLVETEAKALSCLIQAPEAWTLQWKDTFFSDPKHKATFRYLEDCFNRDGAVPPVERLVQTVARLNIAELGEVIAITHACDLPSLDFAKGYHKELADRSAQRGIATTLAACQRNLEELSPAEILERVREAVEENAPACINDTPPFIDLALWLEGEADVERPTIAPFGAGKALFYAGRLNCLQAEPSVGKTNIAIAAVGAAINEGQTALFIDPEDNPRGFVTRARLLGLDPDAIRDRVFYLHNPEPEDIIKAQRWAESARPSIVALDGLAEAMASAGADENSATETLVFLKQTLRPFAEVGAAVVIADHVVKNGENRGRFARGSGAKLGRMDGAVYSVETGKPYTPEQPGFVRLKIQKDRSGGVGAVGDVACEVHFTPAGDNTLVEIKSPEAQEEWRPTEIMKKIMDHLTRYSTATKRELRDLGGKSQYIDKAINVLMDEGKITFQEKGQSKVFSLV